MRADRPRGAVRYNTCAAKSKAFNQNLTTNCTAKTANSLLFPTGSCVIILEDDTNPHPAFEGSLGTSAPLSPYARAMPSPYRPSACYAMSGTHLVLPAPRP
eukprot:2167401-Rhodomonas_salina.1